MSSSYTHAKDDSAACARRGEATRTSDARGRAAHTAPIRLKPELWNMASLSSRSVPVVLPTGVTSQCTARSRSGHEDVGPSPQRDDPSNGAGLEEGQTLLGTGPRGRSDSGTRLTRANEQQQKRFAVGQPGPSRRPVPGDACGRTCRRLAGSTSRGTRTAAAACSRWSSRGARRAAR